jgi:group II intron reverse transcriptase/maturase
MGNELDRIAELAKKHGRLQTVIHHVNADTLKEEHKRQESGKATGVDRVTKEEYGENLDENIVNLIDRMKTFSYRPLPVRRTYIPKEGSSDKLRPLGIPAYEDKLVQGVMRNILDAVYEGKFYDFSYGFRAGKSQHQAIKEVNDIIMFKKISWVVDADIKSFYDTLDHEWLIKFLEHDIQDKNFLRYIKRFLKAGIMEGLERYESDLGAPQGGLISPVCANVYLHYVLDMWFDKVVKEKCAGDAFIVRYADDFVCMFQYEKEARKFFSDLKERLAKFGLEIAEDKSKVIRFGRFARKDEPGGKTETFDFLGFAHINGKTREGKYTVAHRISKKKMKIKRARIKEWLKWNIWDKIPKVIAGLNAKLRGLYQYYGISGNSKSLQDIDLYAKRMLFAALRRRSQRSKMTWERLNRILAQFPLTRPKIYVNIWERM